MPVSLEERKANYERRLAMKRKWYNKNKDEISSYNKQYYKENIKLPKSVRKSLRRHSRKHSKKGSRRSLRRHSSKSRRRMLRRKEAEVDMMIQRLVNLKAQYRRELHKNQ